jgi:hypothetical protein
VHYRHVKVHGDPLAAHHQVELHALMNEALGFGNIDNRNPVKSLMAQSVSGPRGKARVACRRYLKKRLFSFEIAWESAGCVRFSVKTGCANNVGSVRVWGSGKLIRFRRKKCWKEDTRDPLKRLVLAKNTLLCA